MEIVKLSPISSFNYTINVYVLIPSAFYMCLFYNFLDHTLSLQQMIDGGLISKYLKE
jgi:hypothetical protein